MQTESLAQTPNYHVQFSLNTALATAHLQMAHDSGTQALLAETIRPTHHGTDRPPRAFALSLASRELGNSVLCSAVNLNREHRIPSEEEIFYEYTDRS